MKMNTVVGRVVARALSLHSNHLPFWLEASSYELNVTGSSETARTILQRGIRLNRTGFGSGVDLERGRENQRERGGKRRKGLDGGLIEVRVNEEGRKDEGLELKIPHPSHLNVLQLILAHIRMELIFLERLRRRRMVLGIKDVENQDQENQDQENGIVEDRDEEEIENEREALESIEVPVEIKETQKEKIKEGPSYASNSIGLIGLLKGSIPLAILRNALGLSENQNGDSLPEDTHYVLSISFLNLVRRFPFLNGDGSLAGIGGGGGGEEGDKLRKFLLDQGHEFMEQRFGETGEKVLKVLKVGRESYDRCFSSSDNLLELIEGDSEKKSNPQIEEESSKNHLLKLASRLHSKGEVELNLLIEEVKEGLKDGYESLMEFELNKLTTTLEERGSVVGDEFPRLINRILSHESLEKEESGLEVKLRALEHFIESGNEVDEEKVEEQTNSFKEINLQKFLKALRKSLIKKHSKMNANGEKNLLVERIRLEVSLEELISKNSSDSKKWESLETEIKEILKLSKKLEKEGGKLDHEEEVKIWLLYINYLEFLPSSSGEKNQITEKLSKVWDDLINRTTISLKASSSLELFENWSEFLTKDQNFKNGLKNLEKAISKTLSFLTSSSTSFKSSGSRTQKPPNPSDLQKIHDLIIKKLVLFGYEKAGKSKENSIDWDEEKLKKVFELILSKGRSSGEIWMWILSNERKRLGLKSWNWLNQIQSTSSPDTDPENQDESESESSTQEPIKSSTFRTFSSLPQTQQNHLINLNDHFLFLTSSQFGEISKDFRILAHLNQLQVLFSDLDQKSKALRWLENARKENLGNDEGLELLERGWKGVCSST